MLGLSRFPELASELNETTVSVSSTSRWPPDCALGKARYRLKPGCSVGDAANSRSTILSASRMEPSTLAAESGSAWDTFW